ncbi:MAG: general secretion pathway protein G [Verrucomicrobiales bacterium]|jgi:general secretion pathway protein G
MKIARHKRNASFRAFSLIEMVLVLGIIALLVGSGIVYLVGVLGVGKESRVKADLNTLTAALRTYETQNLTLPTSKQGIAALVQRPKIKPVPGSWRPMLKKMILDPWGSEYHYLQPGKQDPDGFDIWSAGPDLKTGTEDDIGNWNL